MKSFHHLGKYGVEPGQKVNRETGLFITINYNNTIAPNVTYRGRADFFSNYYNKPENINLYMTNMFTFKILKNLSATYNLDLIYDDKIRIFGPLKKSPGLTSKKYYWYWLHQKFATKEESNSSRNESNKYQLSNHF